MTVTQWPRYGRGQRVLILILGLLAIQFILFGPSLIGQKILLPLDILTLPNCYLSPQQCQAWGPPYDPILSDPVLEFELERRFAVSEIRAGRMPLWDPHEYCGVPFLAENWSCVFSPYRLLDYLWPGPWVIAWDQMLKSLVAGLGAYCFARRVLGARFPAAVFGAWIWSICAYYIEWAGSPESATATWLPWLLLFTDLALREPRRFWGIALAGVTALMLFSGHAETAGQELLAAGFFFLWRFMRLYGVRGPSFRRGAAAIGAVAGGWLLGILLSAPQSLPTLEYLQNSNRVASRLHNRPGSETPPAGFSATPQLVIPYFSGATHRPAYYFGTSGNTNESAATGYVGLISALFFAPLAFTSRRHRSLAFLFLVMGILGLGQVLGLPPLRQIYDSFPLNLMRENRLVLLTGFSIAMLAVMGLDALLVNAVRWHPWMWGVIALPLALGITCAAMLLHGPPYFQRFQAHFPAEADAALHWFAGVYVSGIILCAAAILCWLGIWRGVHRGRWFGLTVGFLALAEVIVSAFNVYPQADPSLYYPPQPMLEHIASSAPGRICAHQCLPACLPEIYRLYDVRGYDGIDPARLVDLLSLTQPNLFQRPGEEAEILQNYSPARFPTGITRMLNLRYLIFAGTPPANRHPRFATDGYWLYEDTRCLPRAFVPRHVISLPNSQLCLGLLAQPDFDPRNVAYVESDQPALAQPCEGSAEIISETPSHLAIHYDLKTPGMIYLADLWYPGWTAHLNGRTVPVLRANYTFRGVLAPAGSGTLVFDYEPAPFHNGLWLASATVFLLFIWGIVAARRPATEPKSPPASDHPPAEHRHHAFSNRTELAK